MVLTCIVICKSLIKRWETHEKDVHRLSWLFWLCCKKQLLAHVNIHNNYQMHPCVMNMMFRASLYHQFQNSKIVCLNKCFFNCDVLYIIQLLFHESVCNLMLCDQICQNQPSSHQVIRHTFRHQSIANRPALIMLKNLSKMLSGFSQKSSLSCPRISWLCLKLC